jgi:alpha-glucosidase
LSSPPAVGTDTSWIKPGKVIREVTLSTEGGKQAIDFAKARNLQYVEFDDGWFPKADATRIREDRKLDFAEIIRDGKENGIGILLYVDSAPMYQQLGVLFPMFEKWGVAGVKLGFVNVGSQHWTKWLYDAVELAGKHHLVVDIHDEHRPTGLSRTYPWVLTQEGVHGNEEMPPPEHNTVLPFTRFVAGAADYTICYYVDRIKTTRAHQLALAVVYYSPLQFLYWYDRPDAYHSEPEIEFFDHVPVVWDDTKVVAGEIGRYISVARRSGDEWYVGTINNGVPRTVPVALSFLPAGRKFTAHLYESVGRDVKQVRMSTRQVDSTITINAVMGNGGGQAIWIEPQR